MTSDLHLRLPQTTFTILLWASLAVAAAWVGPAVGGGSLFNTRSLSACDTLADVLGVRTCPQLEGLYEQLVTGA